MASVGAVRREGAWALVLLVAVVGGGGCSDEGDDGGSGPLAGPAVEVVATAGHAVLELQDERFATRESMLGNASGSGVPSPLSADMETDDALDDLGEAIRGLGVSASIDPEIALTELRTQLRTLRTSLSMGSSSGGVDVVDAATSGFDLHVDTLLGMQAEYAEGLDDPVVDIYVRTTRLLDDLADVAWVARSGGAAWADTAAPLHDAVVASRDRLADDAQGTELADATTALTRTLADAGFDEPSAASPDDFVESLSIDAWQSYHDVVRHHLTPT